MMKMLYYPRFAVVDVRGSLHWGYSRNMAIAQATEDRTTIGLVMECIGFLPDGSKQIQQDRTFYLKGKVIGVKATERLLSTKNIDVVYPLSMAEEINKFFYIEALGLIIPKRANMRKLSEF